MIKNSALTFDNRELKTESTFPLKASKKALSVRLKSYFDVLLKDGFLPHTPAIHSVAVRIENCDPLFWLHAQDFSRKMYWADREQTLITAGAGTCVDFHADGPIDSRAIFSKLLAGLQGCNAEVRYFGGIRFYEPVAGDDTWQGFGSVRFSVPRFELRKAGGRMRLICHFKLDHNKNPRRQLDALIQEIERLSPNTSRAHTCMPGFISRQDRPEYHGWADSIRTALEAFRSGSLAKVVLARKSTFSFEEPLDPVLILKHLRSSNPQLFYYYFQIAPQVAFLGGSPERLYKRQGQQIKSEAIAGTRPRGGTLEEDTRLGHDLMTSKKDRLEHRLVLETIEQTLERICQTVDVDDDISLLKLARLQHLCCRLQGVLKHSVTDAEILHLLHPTPAVGGLPRNRAIETLRRLEPFDRGWYAGPVGWVSAEDAEFVVAIRSGLVQQERLSLFSGAGIVEGSTPKNEWDEIENKISNFMKVLAKP